MFIICSSTYDLFISIFLSYVFYRRLYPIIAFLVTAVLYYDSKKGGYILYSIPFLTTTHNEKRPELHDNIII